jgi:Crinkler effector protein N-terminal domain
MAANAIDLFCVTTNDHEVFSIQIQSSETVSTLRNRIYQASQNTLPKIDAKHLKLFHVEIPDFHDMPRDDLKKAVAEELSNQPTNLSLNRKVANLFTEGPTDDTLIIAQPPLTGEWHVSGEMGRAHWLSR